jgi:DNA end-binding protein Ku
MLRAMWKAVVRVGDESVPVKLYAAAQSGGVHFRLLHAPDGVPIQQRMVDPRDGAPVPKEEIRRAWAAEDGRLVVVTPEDVAGLRPAPSPDITVTAFVAPHLLRDEWFDRPYWLGPDGPPRPYFALVAALERTGRCGVARWAMRNTRYVGALAAAEGHLRLVSLRRAGAVVDVSQLRPPRGREPEERELALARQLLAALEGPFEPETWRDEYRARVEDLIARKARGERIEIAPAPEQRAAEPDLEAALRASLKAQQQARTAGRGEEAALG